MAVYSFDSTSMLRDGRRWFPTMGEIHYSRVQEQYWAETLQKMRAGGVDIVSAYVIWIHHEEIEGKYDWTGCRDLRAFAETAKRTGVKLLLRIGPWSHGEVRNGGFPDWLLHKDFEPRTNDERYFAVVERWYAQIYAQVADFIARPGEPATADAPIIGVQIENEYGHCGGLSDEAGDAHMRRLQETARRVGFDVAFYTATGWGGARTGGMLPVMGGYCDAPWDPRITELEPSGNYIFTYERNDHNIGSDHGLGYGLTFDVTQFPYLTAELGGGLQVTSHRRTVAMAKDIAAVALTKLGSGCNLLGYYMYAGGTNPEGKRTTLQETRDTGYPNDLPVKSYDFRAPVREFGQVSDTLRELKLLAYFTRDFGEELCALPARIPADNPLDPADTERLRYSFRSDGTRGYAFVNNYVRHQKRAAHRGLILTAPGGKGALPAVDVADGDFFFLPFNMTYSGAKVTAARATPLCSLGEKTVFYKRAGDSATSGFFTFADDESAKVGAMRFLLLSREQALHAWKGADSSRLFLCAKDSYVRVDERGRDVITGRGKTALFSAYPPLDSSPIGWEALGAQNENADAGLRPVLFQRYQRRTGATDGALMPFPRRLNGSNAVYRFDLSGLIETLRKSAELSDCFVTFGYVGERAALYGITGGVRTLLLDHFFMGKSHPWEIGLKRFIGTDVDVATLELEIVPLEKDAPIYLEERPQFAAGVQSRVELTAASYAYEWSYTL